MNDLRTVAQQALEALEHDNPAGRTATITALRAALAEPTVKESLQVPAEVAATMTTTDIAWLATCRLTKLWQELGRMKDRQAICYSPAPLSRHTASRNKHDNANL